MANRDFFSTGLFSETQHFVDLHWDYFSFFLYCVCSALRSLFVLFWVFLTKTNITCKNTAGEPANTFEYISIWLLSEILIS